MKKILLSLSFLVTAFLLTGNSFAQNLEHPSDTLNSPPAKYTIPVRTMEIPIACRSEINIDGFGDEARYSDEQTTFLFNDAGWSNAADFTCSFKAAWNETYLYLYVEITDDIAHETDEPTDNTWEFDNFEIFVDADTSWTESQWTNGADAVPADINQMRINRGTLGVSDPGNVDATDWLYVEGTNSSTGWSVECAMPWTAVMSSGDLPVAIWERAIGFDLSGADSDGDQPGPAGARDAQTSWDTEKYDNPDNAWYHRNVFGLVRVEYVLDLCEMGIQEISDKGIQLYPNPASDIINLSLDGLTTLKIYTATGIQIMEVESTGTVDVSMLSTGLYFISDGVHTLKFVVQ